jgi:hypothetical protein
MSSKNIRQVADFSQLKIVVSENLTVVIGMVCPVSSTESKVMIKKFLKRKAELYPLIQFVYMELTENQIETTKIGLVSSDYDMYPLIYHIRDGNKILCEVERADIESTYESFDAIKPHYEREMQEFKRSIKNKKAKVVINLPGSELESEIEIDDKNNSNDGDSAEIGFDESNKQNESNKSIKPNKSSDVDPQTKISIDKETYRAIENKYGDMQNSLFEEIKLRYKIEKSNNADKDNDSDDDPDNSNNMSKKNRKNKDKKISKLKDNSDNKDNGNNKDKSQHQHPEPKPPQRDRIGKVASKTKQKQKQKQTERRRVR